MPGTSCECIIGRTEKRVMYYRQNAEAAHLCGAPLPPFLVLLLQQGLSLAAQPC